MSTAPSPRDLAYAGLFGAAALLLPTLFHLVHLGSLFMPMYLPLVALAFFAAPVPAAVTAGLVPLLSGALTGMPPFYPPVAVLMAIELSAMAAAIATARRLRPSLPALAVLAPVLAAGRVLHVALVHLLATFLDLPARFLAGVSVVSGWPGVLLMLVAVPAVVRLARPRRAPALSPPAEAAR